MSSFILILITCHSSYKFEKDVKFYIVVLAQPFLIIMKNVNYEKQSLIPI